MILYDALQIKWEHSVYLFYSLHLVQVDTPSWTYTCVISLTPQAWLGEGHTDTFWIPQVNFLISSVTISFS